MDKSLSLFFSKAWSIPVHAGRDPMLRTGRDPMRHADGEQQGSVSRCSPCADDKTVLCMCRRSCFKEESGSGISSSSPRTALNKVKQRFVEQMTEMLKISSQNKVLQRTRDQILDDRMPQMMEQLKEMPKMVPQNRIQQQTTEQIVDTPAFEVFSQDTVQQRFVEQNIENPVDESISQHLEESVEISKTVLQLLRGFVNKVGLSKCPRSQAKTKFHSVQWGSFVSRVNERNNELPSKEWTSISGRSGRDGKDSST